MAFLPCFNINSAFASAAIKSGALKLQSGQWITTSESDCSKSVLVRAERSGYIHAIHGRTPSEARSRYLAYVRDHKAIK